MRILIIFLIATLFLSSGCQMTDEEIQAKLIEANTGLTTYAFDMTMKMDLSAHIDEQQIEIGTDLLTTGKVDRDKKRASMVGTVNMDYTGMRTEMDTEAYVIDDMLYSKSMNIWVKSELEEGMWEQQDQVAQALVLIKSGTLERMEDDSFGGNDYYVFKISPDIEMLIEALLQGDDLSAMIGDGVDLKQMIREYTSTVWINKDTFVIEKSKADMVMVMSPEDLGEEGSGEMRIIVSVDTAMSEIGEDMVIELPEEAKDALDMSEIMDAFAPDEPAPGNSITGAAIAKVFT